MLSHPLSAFQNTDVIVEAGAQARTMAFQIWTSLFFAIIDGCSDAFTRRVPCPQLSSNFSAMQQQESQEIPQATTAVIVEYVHHECLRGRGRLHDAVVSQTARLDATIASCGASQINLILNI